MILKSFSQCIVRFVWPLVCLAPFLAAAQTYVPPAHGRESVNLNPNWRFIRQDVAGAEATGFDDTAWSVINLPHTWNNLDGQDGGNNYYRGIGWYRTHLTPASTNAGKQFFLKFNGAALVTDVWVNGVFVGQHQGGFAAFVFDVTPHLIVGADNVIAVKVNNAVNSSVPPASGDFTVFGGLYRDVQLLLTDRVQISPLDYGSPGVYLMPTNVSAASANLQVTTVLSNASPTLTNVMVRTVITDAQTNIVATLTNLVTLPATSGSNVVAHTVIANPRLWNGRYDPYVYRAFVEVWKGGAVVDLVVQPLGFRFFHVNPTNGFFLNGAHYDLHGVNFHQDWLNSGWALNNAQRETNMALIEEVGATIVRVAHYQHDDYTYTLADRKGLVVWAEVPYIGAAPTTSANLLQQLRELIRQNFNHPAIVCWGLYNEIHPGNQPTVDDEVLVAAEDPTRFNTAASNRGDGDVTTFKTQTICWNKYFGWYNSPINGIAAWADNIHANYPTRSIGIGEYGAGGSIYQHSEDPVPQPAPNSGPHPQEWQNLVHETNWLVLRDRPFLWAKILWNMFDFAVDSRNEGDTPGRNDKGLVTYDRQTRKDVFYFYKSQWTTNALVYLTGQTFTNRLTNQITAKVYANCDVVQLYVDGISQGSRTSTNGIYTWPITISGTNTVMAAGTKGATLVTNSLVWTSPNTGIAKPAAPSGLIATTISSAQINLAWTDHAANETGFKIERSTDGVNFGPVATVAANVTSYADITVSPVVTYYYRVRANNAGGDSQNSNIASATTPAGPPAPPTGLNATSGDGQVALVWNSVFGADGYVLKRSTSSGGPYATIASLANTSYLDSGLANGTTYFYVVASTNNYGPSANSGQVIAIPFAVVLLEAENAILSGAFATNNNAGYSGTGFADYANASADYVQWNIAVPYSGTYTLEFRYALISGNRPLALSVNGTTVVPSLAFPSTGSFSLWSAITNQQYLIAGNNTLQLTAIGASGPNIDYLRLLSGTPPTPPFFNGVLVSPNSVVFSGTGAVANTSYYILTATNLNTPMAQWTHAATNVFDASGNFIFTNSINPADRQKFYRLQMP